MEEKEVAEALRLKSLAEHHYLRSDLKSALSHAKKALRLSPSLSGLPQMIAALRILRAPPFQPFRVLSLPASSSLSSIRHRHRALSVLLRSPPLLQCSSDALSCLNAAFHRLTSKKPPENPTLAEMQLHALRLKSHRRRSSDFHDFAADRARRTFRKGEVWAVGGVPRRYAIVDEVLSSKPLRLRIFSLELMAEEDSSCGSFKVGRKEEEVDPIDALSHLVACKRVAMEIYTIYPRKGSIWAVYREGAVGKKRKRLNYDIVVVLLSYSDAYGMTAAHLEKVDGFTAVFQRKEIGAHAVMCLGKDDLRSFSHQIPAWKLSGEEGSGVPKDSWELDLNSLNVVDVLLGKKNRGGG